MDLIYGRKPILESLRASRRSHQRLFLLEGIEEKGVVGSITHLARQARLTIERMSRDRLQQLVGHRHHQGVALATSGYPYVEVEEVMASAWAAAEPPFLLVLDLLQDPQNIGSLLRTAEAVGVNGVLLQARRAAGITPAVVSSSSGAVEHLLVAQVTNLVRTLRRLQDEHVWCLGLEAAANATRIDQVCLDGPLALVVGGEGPGLRHLVRRTCDSLACLPMRGRVESLNAAIAGSVALYGVWQARGFR